MRTRDDLEIEDPRRPSPLHGLARCPYHPAGRDLLIHRRSADQIDSALLTCHECGREYSIEEGVYRLMPDEFRQIIVEPKSGDGATIQKKREMQQRDSRASASGAGYVPHPSGSALEWMNVQYDAVTRRVAVPPRGVWIDYGTGVGRYVPWLLERAEHVVGTDLSFESLRTLRRGMSDAQRARCLLVQCDLSRLGLASGIGSSGSCVEVLQHLPTHTFRESAILEMGRTLTPGADLFLVTKSFTALSRLIGILQLATWSILRVADGQRPRPMVDQETLDGAIYTYRYTYRELRRLVHSSFVELDARGIIAFGVFPVTLLPRPQRYRVDAWLERSRLGRFIGQDMLLRLRRHGNRPQE